MKYRQVLCATLLASLLPFVAKGNGPVGEPQEPLALALAPAAAAAAAAQPGEIGLKLAPLGGEFLVNSYSTDRQNSPSVAIADDGDFVVVWHSGRSYGLANSSYDIKGQRFASDGSAVGGEFQINSYTTAGQSNSAVASLANGDFVVVWQSLGSSGTDTDGYSIQGQRFASNGTALGSEFQINSYTTGEQSYPAVAAAASGDFVVVWQSSRGSEDRFSYSVQGQRFASDGSFLGGQFLVNSYTSGHQLYPALGTDAEGHFTVVWKSDESADDNTSGTTILGQRFASDGTPLATEFQINLQPTGPGPPDVAVAPDGDFAVVWDSPQSTGDDDSLASVQLRRFASDGTPLAAAFQVNTYTTSNQTYAVVAAVPDGEFVVAWQSLGSNGTDTDERSIQGRRFASDGAARGPEFQINTNILGDQRRPAIAFAHGELVVAWDHGEMIDDRDISAQRYIARCEASESVACFLDGRFRVTMTWRDFENLTGNAQLAGAGGDESALFYFFTPQNWESMVKMVDACNSPFESFWVFAAATTNIEYTISVLDTETGVQRTYTNPLGTSANAITDTAAFKTCP